VAIGLSTGVLTISGGSSFCVVLCRSEEKAVGESEESTRGRRRDPSAAVLEAIRKRQRSSCKMPGMAM